MLRTTGRRLGAGIAALALAIAAAPAAHAEPEFTELKIEAAFDKPSYAAGMPITLRLTISNIGALPAEKVTVSAWDANFHPSSEAWGELDYRRGALIEPGATRTFEVTAYMSQLTDSVGIKGQVLSPSVRSHPGPDFDLRSEVRATTGGWTGVVYGDRNENNQVDPGELLSRTKIILYGGVPYSTLETTTGPDGAFAFQQIPTGRYSPSVSAPDGWVTRYDEVIIEEGPARQADIRGVRPLTDRLTASIAFKKKDYQPGDIAQVRVTLTNRGSTPITGLKAFCNRIGDPNHLNGVGPGWGALNWDSSGVTVAAGEAKTVIVSESVPAAAREWGEVVASCDFGPDDSYTGYPQSSDVVRVAGRLGGADFNVVQQGGAPIAGVTMLFVDPFTRRVVDRKVSDANGKFQIRDRQVGRYEVIVLGPWKHLYADTKYRLWATNPEEWITVVPR